MSEPKFTKGEWSASCVKLNGEELRNGWGVEVKGATLANVYTGATYGVVHEQQKANANLIAAAPEMYEMLDDAWRVIYGLIDEVNDQRMSRVHSQTETPPDLYDMESIHLIKSLLAKARGEK